MSHVLCPKTKKWGWNQHLQAVSAEIGIGAGISGLVSLLYVLHQPMTEFAVVPFAILIGGLFGLFMAIFSREMYNDLNRGMQ
jgi:hypothetical protein